MGKTRTYFSTAAVVVQIALAATAQEIPFSVLKIANPTPANDEDFGYALAAVGTDRVLIGAPFNVAGGSRFGAAYLFSISGKLLNTFTNPVPATNDYFGYSVAAIGADQILVGAPGDDAGAPHAGAAYLFDTNGTVLNIFTNPIPGKGPNFGRCVVRVGSDRLLIGSPSHDTNATAAAAAYLYRMDGALLNIFTSTSPPGIDQFGATMTTVGTDRLVIGSTQAGSSSPLPGKAFLFTTNGALLTTFTNPLTANGDLFGFALAAMGSNRIFIGAHGQSNYRGAMYLFDTDGTLLTTFTNPTPAINDTFGYAVVPVSASEVLISAPGDPIAGSPSGSAYIFNTNGALLATFTNPTPSGANYFASAVTTVGPDRLLLGAEWDNAGAMRAGAAYLFALGYPKLTIDGAVTNFTIGWKSVETDLILQETETLSLSTLWTDALGTHGVIGVTNFFAVTISPTDSNRFYKLRRP